MKNKLKILLAVATLAYSVAMTAQQASEVLSVSA